ncbi:MAG: hypothetical protein ACK554_10745 [Erythrobacteraceae bacterium]|jgi:peptidoglycan/LPS O-acetylase OafA/YrhL
MNDKKPASVRVFDCLYWLAIVFMILNNLLNALAISNSDSGRTFEVFHLFPTVVWIVTASMLWYFASLRKSITAIAVIAGLALLLFLTYYWGYPDAAWSRWTWVLIKIGPLLLLVTAVGAMMTPMAKSWRANKNSDLSSTFE